MNEFEKKEIRREANYRASLILQAVLNEPWEPSDLIEKRGEEYVEKVTVEIFRIAGHLMRSSQERERER
jgi:hypothetical protein